MNEIKDSTVFSGGKRHHELVEKLLPQNAVWIDITVPLSDVFDKYRHHDHIVIFASGDPLFFGFANTVMRIAPEVEVKVFPYFNSLQLLAHKLLLPYQNMKIVSLTGRPWKKFDAALISGDELIGVLTDKHCTPSTIARRMVEYGYTNYKMSIGECLGNEKDERIRTFDVVDAVEKAIDSNVLNCIILQCTKTRERLLGIPESMFELLDGRANMITKAAIRLASISALHLSNKSVLWDIGFCTGSVSIEAKSLYPEISVVAFERRPDCERIIKINMQRFGTPGIDVHIGDFLDTDLTEIPCPDAVFVGGHGGKLIEIIGKVMPLLADKGRIVLNAVSEKSIELFEEASIKYDSPIIQRQRIIIDDHNPILVMVMEKK